MSNENLTKSKGSTDDNIANGGKGRKGGDMPSQMLQVQNSQAYAKYFAPPLPKSEDDS